LSFKLLPTVWMLVRRPHVPLVALLIAAVAVYPFLEGSEAGRFALNLFVMLSIVLSLHHVDTPLRAVATLAGLGLASAIGQVLYASSTPGALPVWPAAVQTLFHATAAMLMCAYMLRDTRATVDELFAAAAAFMLIALTWATAYWCIDHVDPAAFANTHRSLPDYTTWFEFLYLSMTTLTTTGYGDIVPVASMARSAVILEQYVGVLYVALVISRLAGFSARPEQKDE